jgi:hypothetical protein
MDNGATIEELEQMDFVARMKDAVDGNPFTVGGCIMLTSRTGNMLPPRNNSQGDSAVLLGYSKYKSFYVPKYETAAQKQSLNPDERTTIHWQPQLILDEQGKALVSFYSADRSFSTYTVTVEGITMDGRPVRYVKIIK